jgi:3-methylcrotonyl-CoA carboxylase beta subunit
MNFKEVVIKLSQIDIKIFKHAAMTFSAFSIANFSKVTTIIGASYYAGNNKMSSCAYSPRFLNMLPSTKISVMDGTQAAEVLSLTKDKKDESKTEEIAKFIANTIKNY